MRQLMRRMAIKFQSQSINTKLFVALIIGTSISLVAGLFLILIYERVLIRPALFQQLDAMSRVLEFRLLAPLAFDDNKAAAEDLTSLSAINHVTGAALYRSSGDFFAGYGLDLPSFEQLPEMNNLVLRDDYFHFTKTLFSNEQVIGYLYIRMAQPTVQERQLFYLATYFLVLVTLVILGSILYFSIKKTILLPVIHLTDTAKMIAVKRDYSVRLIPKNTDEIGQLGEWFNTMLSVIQQHADELLLSAAKLFNEKELAQITLSSISDGVIVTDTHGYITFLNVKAEKLTGWKMCEAEKKPFNTVFNIHSEGRNLTSFNIIDTLVQKTGFLKTTYASILNLNGEKVPVEVSVSPIKNSVNQLAGAVVIFRDNAEKRTWEKNITYQATHDRLTGLPNRILLEDRLQTILLDFAYLKVNPYLAVLFLDLDRFKQINDTFGHNIGDILLFQVAQRLKRCVRSSDIVCRQGGDEFVILLTQLESKATVEAVAKNMIDSLAKVFSIDHHLINIGASVGVAFYGGAGEGVSELLKKADIAMYHAKSLGRNNYQLYTPYMHSLLLKRNKIEIDLKNAFAHNELTLVYQPQYSFELGRLRGVEALLRCHSHGGLLSPVDFIPVAEDCGLIVPIGEWVLREACLQRKKWQEMNFDMGRLSINISAVQLKNKDFLALVKNIIMETKIDPCLLEFELTESVLIQSVETQYALLKQLKDLGIQLSLDDFGTGYSSLSYLKKLPIDLLKIDKSFIDDIVKDASSLEIARAIISLAKTLQLEVIAEGVELPEQLNLLRDSGCNIIQGHYICSPKRAAELVGEYDVA